MMQPVPLTRNIVSRSAARYLGLILILLLVTVGLTRPLDAQSASSNDISGMYTFLREGEFVQLTLDDGKLSGYISRFGDSDSDKGEFIDQFFDKTSLEGDRLTFNTKTVHGVWYDFKGIVTTSPGKRPSEEGYRVMKGTLVQHVADASGGEKAQQRQVEFRSFPDTLGRP